MSTISNERLEEIAEEDNGSDVLFESSVLARELLALRKEREKAEPVVKAAEKLVRCKGRYHSEQNYRALAALFGVSTPDLPPLETDTTSQQFESLAGKAVVTDEKGNLPCPFCGGRCEPNGWMGSYDDGVPMCGPECEDCGATANSIEEWNRRSTALAGKAVVPAGWKLVPIELTKEMRGKIHPFAEATCLNCGRQVVADCEDNVTASWNDMLAVAPDFREISNSSTKHFRENAESSTNGWIPCNERMPVEKDIVLVVDDGYFVCEAQYREGDFFSAARGNNEFFETICRDVEFWQPLPEPPCK